MDARKIVELFEKDASSRKRLAELLVAEPDIRLAMINAVIRDVATRDDVERLRAMVSESTNRLEAGINGLETRIDGLETRINSLEAGINGLETRIDGLETRIDRLETRINGLDARVGGLEAGVSSLDARVSGLEARIGSLDARVGKLEGQMSLLIKLFTAFNLPILLGIIGILLKLMFS